VSDNLSLKAGEYQILLKGVEISRFEMPRGCELAIRVSKVAETVEGVLTHDPAFHIPAVWVTPERTAQARAAGYMVVDALTVLSVHLGEVSRRYGHELLSRQNVSGWLERVREENPELVEELVPRLLPVSTVQGVLRNLLRERVPIRDGCSILRALNEAAHFTRNSILLSEYVRQNIRGQVVSPYLDANGELAAFVLGPAIERAAEGWMTPQIDAFLARIRKAIETPEAPAVLLTSAGSRRFIRKITEDKVCNLAVISHAEVPAETRVRSLGVIQ